MSDFSAHFSKTALPALDTDTTKVILENLSIVMTYVFSYQALADFYGAYFVGHHRFLMLAFTTTPQRRATRALLELAVLYRALDDTQSIVKSIDPEDTGEWGKVHTTKGEVERLPLRELVNKIIHAEEIGWSFKSIMDPQIVCFAGERQQELFGWTEAVIPMSALATACSGLVS